MSESGTAPLVSVCVTTFNHRNSIARCLNSVLAQDVAFPFEIVVGEDGSEDGTREVCLEYAEREGERFRLLLNSRETVVYFAGKPTGQWNFLNTLSCARGKYVALLEGDDRWIDSSKLQRQIEVLEADDRASGCFHACRVEYTGEPGRKSRLMVPPGKREEYRLDDILVGNFVATSSVVFRREGLELPPEMWKLPMGDRPLHLLNLIRGSYRYIDRAMSVYAVHPGGSWSQLPRAVRLEGSMAFYSFAESVLGPVYRTTIREHARQFRLRQSRRRRALRWSKRALRRLGARAGWGLSARGHESSVVEDEAE